MNKEKLNIIIPQWQGGGQDLCTYHAAYALKKNYIMDQPTTIVEVSTADISPVKNDILGYDDILVQLKKINQIVVDAAPGRIFTLGGGCDADTACAAYLNKMMAGDMAVVYIDSHGDLNTPQSSDSKLYYGMSLRALAGDCDQGIIDTLESRITPNQLIMCANRSLDPEELSYVADNNIASFTVEEIENNPKIVAEEIARKNFKNVYIHIDLDSLDPNEFQLTPVPEPNGLKCDTLIDLINEIKKTVNVVGFAVLEYCGSITDKENELLTELVKFGTDI